MLKKLLVAVLLISGFAIYTMKDQNAEAATIVNVPSAVGTYNDFGQNVRLRIKPTIGAVKYKISYKAYGENTYTSYMINSSPNIYINRLWWTQTGFHVNTMGICLIEVRSVAQDGELSVPLKTFVNIIG